MISNIKEGSDVMSNEAYEIAPNFVPELAELLKDDKFTLRVSAAGEKGEITTIPDGKALVYYDGTEINKIDTFNYKLLSVIFIPEDTEDTVEAYIETATKRINDAYPNVRVEIEENNNLNDEIVNIIFEDATPYYKSGRKLLVNLRLNDAKLNFGTSFAIIANNDYMQTLNYEKKEPTTGIVIKTPDCDIPLDTVISVEDLTNVKEIIDTVKEKILTEIHKIFDISLYSESKGENITKLESGMFEVTLPLGESFIGKNLSAYYIKDNGEVEEHKITMDEFGNGTFETDHFSRYIIADASENNIEIPKTLDNINLYIFLGIISLISLSICGIYLKKIK